MIYKVACLGYYDASYSFSCLLMFCSDDSLSSDSLVLRNLKLVAKAGLSYILNCRIEPRGCVAMLKPFDCALRLSMSLGCPFETMLTYS